MNHVTCQPDRHNRMIVVHWATNEHPEPSEATRLFGLAVGDTGEVKSNVSDSGVIVTVTVPEWVTESAGSKWDDAVRTVEEAAAATFMGC